MFHHSSTCCAASSGEAVIHAPEGPGRRRGSASVCGSIVALAGSADAPVAAAAIGALKKFENPTAFEAVARSRPGAGLAPSSRGLEVIGHWDWHNHEAVAILERRRSRC